MAETFDPYYKWLAIPPAEQPPDHYRLLGIRQFESDPEIVHTAADQRMVHLRTFQSGPNGPLSQRLLNEVAAAKLCLLNPAKRAAYDAALRQRIAAREARDKLAAPLLTPSIRRSMPWLVAVGSGIVLVAAVALGVSLRGGKASSGPDVAKQVAPVTQPESVKTLTDVSSDAPAASPTSPVTVAKPNMLTNSIGMKLVLILPGEFDMGSSDEEIRQLAQYYSDTKTTTRNDASQEKFALTLLQSETPRHRVQISKSFYLGVYEVTQAEYKTVLGVNPSKFQKDNRIQYYRSRVAGRDTSQHPVESVFGKEAEEFCRRLSALPNEQAARRVYRLPTEAEWEYACRAGTKTRYFFGDDPERMADYAWCGFSDRLGSENDHCTQPVGQRKPNPWGLYDMYGNAKEWCMDYWAPDFYHRSPRVDPLESNSAGMRVCRGGNFLAVEHCCRSAAREYSTGKSSSGGFRVACNQGS